MIGGSILRLLMASLSNQLLNQVESLGVIAIIDSCNLPLPSPVSGGKMIDLQMSLGITTGFIVNNPSSLLVRSHEEWLQGRKYFTVLHNSCLLPVPTSNRSVMRTQEMPTSAPAKTSLRKW